MNSDELRRRVGDILEVEEHASIDWQRVERLTEVLARDLDDAPESECPEVVWHFLSDVDIRKKDDKYAFGQRADVRHFVDTGEYTDSTPVSGWGCLAVVAFVVAVIFWKIR